MTFRRLLLVAGLVLMSVAATPTLAAADDGSITNVRPSSGGQLEGTFSATSTTCGSAYYCGWFPVAWQMPATATCAAGGDEIIYVGTALSQLGTQTQIDQFYKRFEPVKLCLFIYRTSGYQLVAETTYTTPPIPAAQLPATPAAIVPPVPATTSDPAQTLTPAPTLLTPRPDARLTAGKPVTLRARPGDELDDLTIVVSRSDEIAANGTLGRPLARRETDDNGADQSARFDGDWTKQAGTYYWQAVSIFCIVGDCGVPSEVRQFKLVEPPFVFRTAARGFQQLRAPRATRFNNLVLTMRCSRSCRVKLLGRGFVRVGSRLHALRGLALDEQLRLAKGEAVKYGFHFTDGEQARLVNAMRRHGPVRWELRLAAVTDDGELRVTTRVIRMTPPPLPRPKPVPAPRPAPSPQPTRPSCDPSYPGVCIPPAPPDLDCGDVPYSDFEVAGNDPHGFDGDGDGVGCES